MDQDYSGQQLADRARFRGQDCRRDRFVGADLCGADFTDADLREANFRNARLTGACLDGADLTGARLTVAQLGGAQLRKTRLAEANLAGAYLHGADLSGADLTRASLFGANLRGANLSGTHLAGADLEEADLTGADLRGAVLEETTLTKAVFEGASLPGARLIRADLPGADFRGADLSDADFQGRLDFTDTDLSRANLSRANLEGAELSFALSLRGASLVGANLRNALLSGADLREADLSDADLGGARLYETDLRNAKLDRTRGVRVDRTRTGQAIFSHGAPDAWSVLRRYYSGHPFSFALLFLIIFLVPYVARTLFWAGISELEKYVLSHHEQLDKLCDDLEQDPDPQVRNWAGKLRERVRVLKNWFPEHFQQRHIFWVLLGFDRSWWHIGLTVALLLFNLLRGVLVFMVGPMKDEEDRTGVSPPFFEWLWRWPPWRWFLPPYGWLLTPWKWTLPFRGYRYLIWIHYVVRVMMWFSIIAGAVLAVMWLSGLVWVPRPGAFS